MALLDIKKIKEEALKEVNKDAEEKAKSLIKNKLREVEQARKILRNLERELEDLYVDIAEG